MSKFLKKTPEGLYPITIRGKKFVLPIHDVRLKELRFYEENPRVYSALHQGESAPGQDEIQEHLQDEEHVKELKVQIEQNGGLMEPLFVREATMEVVEGNSRLAAYRLLEEENGIKWSHARCALLPSEIDDSLVMSLLAQLHLTGKKNWVPYEQAAIFYRRNKVENVSIPDLAKESNLKQEQIRHRIRVIELMIEANDNQLSRWSYYDEFLKSRKIQKACDNHAALKGEIIKQIKSGKIGRAQDIRDKLKVVCAADKPIKQFLNGASLDHAFDNAQASGGENRTFSRLNTFRLWIADIENKKSMKEVSSAKKDTLLHELREIKRHVDSLLKAEK
jgi:hypothetical protein